jgi:hypothetical protein
MDRETLEKLPLNRLDLLQDRLRLVGLILGQLALLEVVNDTDAPATARVQSAKTLTDMGGDPQTIIERLRSSTFLDKSPEELKQLVQQLQDDEIDADEFLAGEAKE